MALFEIHFLTLETLGDGDEFVNSECQCTLGGRGMPISLVDVTFESTVTSTTVSPSHVRNAQGSHLHSHPHDHPSGSKQQQVILSRTPHRDSNNDFRIFNATLPILIEDISMRMLSRPTHCDSLRHRIIRNFVRVGYVQFVGLADGCDV